MIKHILVKENIHRVIKAAAGKYDCTLGKVIEKLINKEIDLASEMKNA